MHLWSSFGEAADGLTPGLAVSQLRSRPVGCGQSTRTWGFALASINMHLCMQYTCTQPTHYLVFCARLHCDDEDGILTIVRKAQKVWATHPTPPWEKKQASVKTEEWNTECQMMPLHLNVKFFRCPTFKWPCKNTRNVTGPYSTQQNKVERFKHMLSF